MAVKDAFTAEEWARVVAAPMLAGIAVTAAEPGGIWGAVKESVAVAGAVRAAKADADPLVAEVARRLRDAGGPRHGARRAEGAGPRQGAGGGGRGGGRGARRGRRPRRGQGARRRPRAFATG